MAPIPLIKPGFAPGVASLPPFGGPIRVTTYELAAGEFTGTTYDLTLIDDLFPDYFVMIQGTDNGNNTPNLGGCRVIQDPFGTGELGTSSGSNVIRLQRQGSSTTSWVGGIVVVECTADQATRGFTLVDVLQTSIPSSGTSPQSVNDTLANSWSDINQVVPFGGFRGGGCTASTTTGDDWPALAATIQLSGANTATFKRGTSAAHLEAATWTTYFVEWGSDYTVQAAWITGNNGGGGLDATGEYNTASISSVVRDNAWVFPTIYTAGCIGIGCSDGDAIQGAQAVCVTLGDGVNQNASETSVAAGKEVANYREVWAYVIENANLAVDYRFKTDGDAGVETKDITVDAVAGTESYDEASNPRVTTGPRLGLVTNGAQSYSGTNRFQWGRSTWYARPTAGTTMKIARPDMSADNVTFPAWVQSVDFAGV